MNRRIEWVDIFKGLLIIFVVLGHAAQGISSNEYLSDDTGYVAIRFFKNMIYSFHMPAFFVASGLFFSIYHLNLIKNI